MKHAICLASLTKACIVLVKFEVAFVLRVSTHTTRCNVFCFADDYMSMLTQV